jgi:hypothetical protein
MISYFAFRSRISYLVSRVSYFVNQSCLAFEISIFMGSPETKTPLTYLKFRMLMFVAKKYTLHYYPTILLVTPS